jgi:hypothetical protein
MQYLTNNYLMATPHKVGLNTRERFSYAYFHEPAFQAVIKPIEEMRGQGQQEAPENRRAFTTALTLRICLFATIQTASRQLGCWPRIVTACWLRRSFGRWVASPRLNVSFSLVSDDMVTALSAVFKAQRNLFSLGEHCVGVGWGT